MIILKLAIALLFAVSISWCTGCDVQAVAQAEPSPQWNRCAGQWIYCGYGCQKVCMCDSQTNCQLQCVCGRPW